MSASKKRARARRSDGRVEQKAKQAARKKRQATTDVANARRFAALRGEMVRHKTGFGWHVWDGKRWDRNDKAARRLAHEVGELVRAEAKACHDKDRKKELYRHAKRSENTAGINAMLKEAEVLEGINADKIQFDADPLKLNVGNGTLDLQDGKLHPHNRDDYLTKLVPVDFKPEATCSRFEKFLTEIFADNEGIVEYVKWLIGYSLTGVTSHHLFIVFFGDGHNGKSTFVEVLAEVIGTDYAQQVDPEVLLAQRSAQHPTGRARLRGVRFATSVETNRGRQLDEAFVKGVTGGDRISARYLYREYFEFVPQLTLFLATNHKPVIKDNSRGMWRRLRLIPFEVDFEAEGRKPERNLKQELLKEAEGILALMVRSIVGRLDQEPHVPEAIRSASEQYRIDSDLIGKYLAEHVEPAPGENIWKAELFDHFTDTIKPERISKNEFGARLKRDGFKEGVVDNGRVRVWKDVRYRPYQDEDEKE